MTNDLIRTAALASTGARLHVVIAAAGPQPIMLRTANTSL